MVPPPDLFLRSCLPCKYYFPKRKPHAIFIWLLIQFSLVYAIYMKISSLRDIITWMENNKLGVQCFKNRGCTLELTLPAPWPYLPSKRRRLTNLAIIRNKGPRRVSRSQPEDVLPLAPGISLGNPRNITEHIRIAKPIIKNPSHQAPIQLGCLGVKKFSRNCAFARNFVS